MSNLRIKNKRLKRELELLKYNTVPYKVVHDHRQVVTLASRHTYDDSLYGCMSEELIAKAAIRDFTDNIIPHIRFNLYRDYETGNIVVEAKLDVVSKED